MTVLRRLDAVLSNGPPARSNEKNLEAAFRINVEAIGYGGTHRHCEYVV